MSEQSILPGNISKTNRSWIDKVWQVAYLNVDFKFTACFSIQSPSVCCHLFVVCVWGWGLRTSVTRIAMLAGVYTPGRASQVRQI